MTTSFEMSGKMISAVSPYSSMSARSSSLRSGSSGEAMTIGIRRSTAARRADHSVETRTSGPASRSSVSPSTRLTTHVRSPFGVERVDVAAGHVGEGAQAVGRVVQHFAEVE